MILHKSGMLVPTFRELIDFFVESIHQFLTIIDEGA
jgi:hypothetical protein